MIHRMCLIAAAVAAVLCAGCAAKPRCECCLSSFTQTYPTSYGGTQR